MFPLDAAAHGFGRLYNLPVPFWLYAWGAAAVVSAGRTIIVSVMLAHQVALRVWPTRRQALLSQLPMLALMVLFTVAGLWILAQPLTVERMR